MSLNNSLLFLLVVNGFLLIMTIKDYMDHGFRPTYVFILLFTLIGTIHLASADRCDDFSKP
ncbi:hypothetical protein PED39_05670 [Methanomassiliicoccales archaeon LGM-RCC1]|nr:hypothetical protein PED39_05670 [Methanomassiliicoccales archaeon LGM-RCC1]